jgi:hypothetical protein
MSFIPIVCPPGSGGGEPGADVENHLLCDVDAEGNILGTALAVYEYDADGNPVGPPTFVNPATGDPYVPQGVLQPCPGDTGCTPPVQFCFTTTSTGPVDHPGRMYDLEIQVNPGFAVESLQVDAVNSPANIVWDVSDSDGELFRQDLTSFIEGRVPAAAVVTITNPNVGQVICGTAQPMQIHIECLRLDENPPNLIELIYNAGQDLILNPAYNETPPLNPPVSQGNYGFHLLSRQDDPGPFPINQPSNDADCTNIANRGWETNDIGRTFEIWGADQVLSQNVTPTPRGTPVQEMTSDGPPPGGRSTIWQTFQAPTSGNFIIRVVHGARDAGEQHRITLDNGDTDDAQNGTLINDVTNPAVVTNSPGGPNPWTQFNQTIPLVGGSTYTLALSSTNPVASNRGGLFTDMRAYLDVPGVRETAVTNDETCVVTVDETITVTDCQLWQPRCINGDIVSWRKVDDGLELANAAFWGQAPAPECCLPVAPEGEGGSVAANLVHNYEICGIVGGVPTTLNRVVITDPSGGVLGETIVGPNGAPVAPASYTIGDCGALGASPSRILCDDNGQFVRTFIYNAAGQLQTTIDSDYRTGTPYATSGLVFNCGPQDQEILVLCDDNGPFRRTFNYGLGGVQINFIDRRIDDDTLILPIDHVGPIRVCPEATPEPGTPSSTGEFVLGDDNGCFIRKLIQDVDGTVLDTVNLTLDGLPYVPVGTVGPCPVEVSVQPAEIEFEEEILCDDNGPFFRRTTFNTQTQVYGPVADFTLTGAPYVTVGTVETCGGAQFDVEQECFRDFADVFFYRSYVYTDGSGIPTVIGDFLQDGTPYVPVVGPGFPRLCADGPIIYDQEEEILCDSNGTQFLRRYTWRETDQGVLNPTVSDYDLDGNPFVPVGPVGVCPASAFDTEGICYTLTSTGATIHTGWARHDDSLPPPGIAFFTNLGVPINPLADGFTQVPCAAIAVPVTVNAQHRLIGDADAPWTVGADVVGTLVSVAYTILSGSATVTDQSGTVAAGLPAGLSVSWSAEPDADTLLGPASIDAIGGQVYVHWTQR